MKNIRFRRAFALAVVLWISAALMAVSLYMISVTKESVDNAKRLLDKLQVQLDSESAFEKLIFYLSSAKYWEDSAKNEINEMPKKIILNRTPFEFRVGESNITARVQDIGGIENVTILGMRLFALKRLVKILTGREVSNFVSDSYLDWLDTDDDPMLNGAETPYYKIYKDRAYPSANNRYIEHPDELRLIRGFDELTDKEWKKIRKYFGYSYSGSKNLMAFDEVMMKAYFDLSPSEWEQLRSLRYKDIHKYRDMFLDHIKDQEEREKMNFHPTRSFIVTLLAKRGEALDKIEATVDVKPKVETMINIIEFKK